MPKILGRDGFKNNDRSPNAAVGHAHRVSKGDEGEPVGRIQAFRPMDADPLAIEATPPPVERRERAAAFAPPAYRPPIVAGPRVVAQRPG